MPYLARHFRVITVEGRGNGRADRPDRAGGLHRPGVRRRRDRGAGRHRHRPGRAVGLSLGGRHALQLAAWYPDRAAGVVAIGTALPWPLPPDFDEPRASYEGWEKANRHYWLADYRGWVEFFMSQVFTEPHSIKQREDGVGLGAGDRRRDAAAAPAPASTPPPRRTPRRSAGRCAARCSSCTATRTGSCRTRPGWRWPGGPAGSW